MREQPLVFVSGSYHVVGMLHQPRVAATPRRGVLFLAPNVQARANNARLYVRLSRQLASSGWWAFRFDFPGLGDSEGELIPDHHLDGFSPEVTRTVTAAAIETFCREAQLDEVILCGLCGGARAALNVADIDGRVTGLALLALPLMRNADVGQPEPVRINVHSYLRKARRGVHWKRFLTFQSDYRYFVNALWHLLGGRMAEKARIDAEVVQHVLESLTQGQRLLFLYGTRDPFYQTFVVGLQSQLSRLNGRREADWTLRMISGTSHTFPQAAAQQQLIAETLTWLASRYPAQHPVSVA